MRYSRRHKQFAHGFPTLEILAQRLVMSLAITSGSRPTLCALATSFRGYVS